MIEFFIIIFNLIFILLLPGLILSLLLFPIRNEINLVERIVLSLGLSISIIPIIIFYLYYFLRIEINLHNLILIIMIIVTFSYLGYLKRNKEKSIHSMRNMKFKKDGKWVIEKKRWFIKDICIKDDMLYFAIKVPSLKTNDLSIIR